MSWKDDKNLGPWTFSKSGADNRYNEGNVISTSDTPIWNLDLKRGTPVTTNHLPCGYWTKKYVDPTEPVYFPVYQSVTTTTLPGTTVAWSPHAGGEDYGRFISVYVLSPNQQVSDDGGITWNAQANLNNRKFRDVYYNPITQLWFKCNGYLTDSPYYHISDDGGVTWTEYIHAPVGAIYQVYVFSISWSHNHNCYIMITNDGLVSTNYRRLYSSSNGTTWTYQYQFIAFDSVGKIFNLGTTNYCYAYNYNRLYYGSALNSWNTTTVVTNGVYGTTDNNYLYLSNSRYNGSVATQYYLDDVLFTDHFTGVAYDENLRYVSHGNSYCYLSDDGYHWYTIDDSYNNGAQGEIVFGRDRFVGVSNTKHMTGILQPGSVSGDNVYWGL